MNKLLAVLAAWMVASMVLAQAGLPAGTGTSGHAAAQTAPTGAAASKSDATKSATKQHKKVKKSTVKLGPKTGAVK